MPLLVLLARIQLLALSQLNQLNQLLIQTQVQLQLQNK